MLPEHDVYVTDWISAREVPVADGRFDLDDYIDYVIDFVRLLGPDVHVIAVCQPSVPVLAAVSLMAADGRSGHAALDDADGRADRHARQPDRGQPVRRRRTRSLVRAHVITTVPASYPGCMRRVYPGLPAAHRRS